MTGALARRAAIVAMMIALIGVTACARVPAGHRGIKVYLLGGEKGVNEVELGVGRYFYWPITQEIYIFPVFQQNYTWTKRNSSGEDKSITFQTREGLSVNGDFGISYSVDESRVSLLFQRYRRGLDEITDLFLRNMIRDELNNVSSRMEIEAVYGEQRQEMLREVEARVRAQVAQHGIVIDRLYAIGDFRLPQQVINAINAKIEATQRAQQRENEVRETRAQAAKLMAKTEGEANSLRMQAQAEADANRLRAASITPELIQYNAVLRWNGALPSTLSGTAIPFFQLMPTGAASGASGASSAPVKAASDGDAR